MGREPLKKTKTALVSTIFDLELTLHTGDTQRSLLSELKYVKCFRKVRLFYLCVRVSTPVHENLEDFSTIFFLERAISVRFALKPRERSPLEHLFA